jgi:sulfur carrier protein
MQVSVCVNGQAMQVPAGASVAELVELLKLHPRRIAVERNQRLLPRLEYAGTPLQEGDVLEIVTLVGGG